MNFRSSWLVTLSNSHHVEIFDMNLWAFVVRAGGYIALDAIQYELNIGRK